MSILDSFVKECHSKIFDSKVALDYLYSRGLTKDTIIEHELGYCNTAVPDKIRFFGKDDIVDNDSGYEYFIRNRIILPIRSEFKELVAFATRKPSHEKGNTWWNLSRPFRKGNHLFLLNKSKVDIYNENKAYVVEGYMDALIAYQCGIKNVVALMGVALTPRKIALLARYCNQICFALDCDENEAGQKAANKSILLINEFGFCEKLSMIRMPMGEDPASYLLKNKKDDFLSLEDSLSEKEINEICKTVRSKSNNAT